jgi:hypothetical protein
MNAIVLGVFMLAAMTLSAQTTKSGDKLRLDLNGTWILDESRSNLGNEISDYVLTIVHREPEIRMSKRYQRGKRETKEEIVYYTDGRPEPDPRLRPNDPLPETRWRGNKLVRRVVTRPVGSGSLDFQVASYEEWVASQDKQILTRTITITMGSAIISKKKAVFRRSQ